MASFRKKLKKVIQSKSTPDFLYQIYFDRLDKKKRKWLTQMLMNSDDLIEDMDEEIKKYWQNRAFDVLSGPDNKDINRVENAGQIINDQLVMHNGILVDPLSYYSFPMLQMFMDNKGVHEPQEEKIFQEVLQSLPKKGKKTMLELGSYWCFYTMWFLQKFPESDCYMVEPVRENLFYGKKNLKLNGMEGTFIHAGIGQKNNPTNNVLTVDHICEKNGIEFLDLLHSDIQGFELEMLHGSQRMLSEKRVGYAFISTHSNELHYECKKLLEEKYGFITLASADLEETYSWDGVVVMKSPNYPGIDKVEISKKQKNKK